MGRTLVLAVFVVVLGATANAQQRQLPPLPQPGTAVQSRQPPAQPQPPAQSTQQPPAAEPRGTEQSPFTVQLLNPPKNSDEAKSEKEEKADKHAADWSIVYLTGAIVFVGALQLASFIWQALKMSQTVVEMRRANQVAENALLSGERPWVGIERLNIKPFVAGQRPDVTLIVRNSGKTPAMNLQGAFTALTRPFNQEAPPIPQTPTTHSVTLMPNGTFSYWPFSAHPVLTQQQIDDIANHVDAMWLSGRFNYVDGHGIAHATTVCAFYDSRTSNFSIHAIGNTAD